jgi:hypothetical protein
VEALGKMEM